MARCLGSLILVALSGLLCTTCQWDVGTLDIRLVYTAGASDPFNLDTTDISQMKITVEGENVRTHQTTFDLGGKRSGRLENLPVGEQVKVVVEGLDAFGAVYRGVSSNLTLRRGTNKLVLFFSRVGEFSDPPTVQDAIVPEWRGRYRTQLRPGLGRAFHTASVLADGSVLVAGGTQSPDPTDHLAYLPSGSALRSSEIFDPTAGAFLKDSAFCIDVDGDGWGLSADCLGFDCNDGDDTIQQGCSETCDDHDEDGYGVGDCLGPDCDEGLDGENCAIGECCEQFNCSEMCLGSARAFHDAVPVPSSDDWLMVGGEPVGDSVEVFQAADMEFGSGGSTGLDQRSRQASARIGPGRIMVAGGLNRLQEVQEDILAVQPAEPNPVFENVGSLSVARTGALGVEYPGGSALVVGGWEEFGYEGGIPKRVPSAAIEQVTVDADLVLVESFANLRLNIARAEAAAIVYLTPINKYTRILVCGGLVQNPDTGVLEPTQSCERIKPEGAASTVELLEGDHGLATARWGHTMTLLPNGRVLVAGGFTRTFSGAGLRQAEILDTEEARKPTGSDANIAMRANRGGHTATLMPNGMVLLVGGIAAPGTMSSPGYEIYNP